MATPTRRCTVATNNSFYTVEEFRGGFRVVKDAHKKGSLKVGTVYEGDEIVLEEGKRLLLMKNGQSVLRTSTVRSITELSG